MWAVDALRAAIADGSFARAFERLYEMTGPELHNVTILEPAVSMVPAPMLFLNHVEVPRKFS